MSCGPQMAAAAWRHFLATHSHWHAPTWGPCGRIARAVGAKVAGAASGGATAAGAIVVGGALLGGGFGLGLYGPGWLADHLPAIAGPDFAPAPFTAPPWERGAPTGPPEMPPVVVQMPQPTPVRVPEPSSALILAMPLALLGLLAWKRR